MSNSSGCTERFKKAICGIGDCEVCRPPKVELRIETTEYVVGEDISDSYSALQVCVLSNNHIFPVTATINAISGSATKSDFVFSTVGFSLQIRRPKQCIFVRIIQDDEIEGNEEFSIRLLTSDPIAVLVDSQANVTIVDDDGVSTTTPANANDGDNPTTPAVTVTPSTDGYDHTTSALTATPSTEISTVKTAVVECGIYRRPIKYISGGNDVMNLKEAIADIFPGLDKKHIALMQVKSAQYNGHYVDVLDANQVLENNSYVKVFLYNPYKAVCLL